MTQLYWQVYLNLEREFLALADLIYINDDQQDVYSMRIADLLIRTVVEIEALAKELYLCNGGPAIPNEKMFFDTACMAHLDRLWHLNSKVVQVVSPNIYFEKEENKVFRPLHKASKRGSSSSDWNKAYQAVKHNRVKELHKGNLKNLLHGLAALYVLNLYYRDEKFAGLSSSEKSNANYHFGSLLFSVKIHKVNSLRLNGEYEKSADYDECVYIEDYEPISKVIALSAMKALDDYEKKNVLPKLEQLKRERIISGEQITKEWIDEEKSRIIRKLFPIKDTILGRQITDALGQLRFDIVLNKQQY